MTGVNSIGKHADAQSEAVRKFLLTFTENNATEFSKFSEVC
jgi:hypothetical protein